MAKPVGGTKKGTPITPNGCYFDSARNEAAGDATRANIDTQRPPWGKGAAAKDQADAVKSDGGQTVTVAKAGPL
jgi:hypothetical protein